MSGDWPRTGVYISGWEFNVRHPLHERFNKVSLTDDNVRDIAHHLTKSRVSNMF